MFGFSKQHHHHRGRMIMKWTFNAKSPLLSGATTEDLDKDGKREVVFGTKYGTVICIDEDSKERWRYESDAKISEEESYFYDTERIESIPAPPTIADIDSDGNEEVLFGTEHGSVICLDCTGKKRWSYDAKSPVHGRVLVDDFDNDGTHEVMFGTQAGRFFILSAQGRKRHVFELPSGVESEPAVLRGGPETQLVFGTEDGSLMSYNALGKVLWKFTADEAIRAAPIMGALDSGESIIVGDMGGCLYCLDAEGNEQWRFKSNGAIYSSAAVSDLNDDGMLEIVFGSCDNSVYCLSGKGDRIWSYETDFWVVAKPIIADIDGDGAPEVIVGSFDRHLYVLDGEGDYALDYMPGLSGVAHQPGHYTNMLTQEPGEQVGKRLWQIKTQGLIVGCEVLDKEHIIVNVKSGEIDNVMHKR